MKTVIMNIPTTPKEIGGAIKRNWKKIVGGVVIVGGSIAATVLTKGKIWDKDNPTVDTTETPALQEAEWEENEDSFGEDPAEAVESEETNEETEGN